MAKQPKHPLYDLVGSLVGDKQSGSGASLWITLFLCAALVIAVSVLGIRLALAKRSAAEAKRKLREAEEAHKQAVERERLTANEQARETARKDAEQLAKEVTGLKKEIERSKQAHSDRVEDLRAVTDWDDLEIVDGRP